MNIYNNVEQLVNAGVVTVSINDDVISFDPAIKAEWLASVLNAAISCAGAGQVSGIEVIHFFRGRLSAGECRRFENRLILNVTEEEEMKLYDELDRVKAIVRAKM